MGDEHDSWMGGLGVDIASLRQAASDGASSVVQTVEDTAQAAEDTASTVVQKVEDTGQTVESGVASVIQKVEDTGAAVVQGVETTGQTIEDTASTVVQKVEDTGSSVVRKVEDTGAAVVQGVEDTVQDAESTASTVVQKVEDTVASGGALATLKPRDPPAEDLDEGEGRNPDGTVRRKGGRHGTFRGREGKRANDEIVDEVADELGLTEEERRKLHDEIGGRNLGRKGVRQVAEDLFPDKAKNKGKSKDNENEDEKSGPDLSTLRKVTAAVIALGIAVELVPTIAAAIVDPEPATKLLLIGLTVAEVASLAVALGFVFNEDKHRQTEA